jgi:hypothetical protein
MTPQAGKISEERVDVLMVISDSVGTLTPQLSL